jgi:hypothetical protein
MKKIYTTILILLVSYTINAQTDPELLGQWFLHYTEANGNRTYVPAVTDNPNVFITFNDDANPGLPTIEGDSSCNFIMGEYNANTTNGTISLPFITSTLLLCQGDTFEPTYLAILLNPPTNFFDYTIDIPNETLTMIDLLGVKLVYGRQVLSIEDNETLSNSLKLYPNPTKNELFVADFSIDSKTTYSIYNMVGNVIISENTLQQNPINVVSLKVGIYFLKITQKGKTFIKKFIKI